MVKVTDGTITIELTCEEWALMGETPMTGFTVSENTCSTYGLSFFAPFASFDIGSGSGTVTSVGLELPDITYDVTGSPVTDSGVLTGTYIDQPAKYVLIGPVSGADDSPTWRQIVPTDIGGGTATNGQVLVWNSGTNTWTPATPASGTVTSVALSLPTAIFDVSGSPITSSGTFTVTLDTQTAKTFFAGPTTGANATPTFRLFALTDIPQGGASNSDVLSWNGSQWTPVAPATGTVTGTGVAGQVAYWGSTTAITGENELFYDATNNRLSVGTNAATANLYVTRASTTTATISHFLANCSTLLLAYLQNTNTAGGQAVFEINTTGTTANTAQAATRYSAGGAWQVGAQRLATGNQFVIANDTVLNTTQTLIIGNSLTGSFGPSPVIIALVNFNFTGTGGVKLPVGDNSQRPTLSTAYGTIRANNQIGGVEYYNQKGTWSRLSCIVGPGGSGFVGGTGAGTSPTITTANASDKKGVMNIQAGTSPGAAGTTIITVTYGVAYSETPIVILGRNNATGSTINFHVASYGTTGFTVAADTALTAGATYSISYIVQD